MRGQASTLPNLVIHVIAFILVVAVVIMIYGLLFDSVDHPEAEHELENFVGFLNAFVESDRMSDKVLVGFSDRYVFVYFDEKDRKVFFGEGHWHTFLSGARTTVEKPLINTCREKCLCSYNVKEEGYVKVVCEDVKARVIMTEGGHDNGDEVWIDGGKYDLLMMGSGIKDSAGAPMFHQYIQSVSLKKIGDSVLVENVGMSGISTASIDRPDELGECTNWFGICSEDSNVLCYGKKDDTWYQCMPAPEQAISGNGDCLAARITATEASQLGSKGYPQCLG